MTGVPVNMAMGFPCAQAPGSAMYEKAMASLGPPLVLPKGVQVKLDNDFRDAWDKMYQQHDQELDKIVERTLTAEGPTWGIHGTLCSDGSPFTVGKPTVDVRLVSEPADFFVSQAEVGRMVESLRGKALDRLLIRFDEELLGRTTTIGPLPVVSELATLKEENANLLKQLAVSENDLLEATENNAALGRQLTDVKKERDDIRRTVEKGGDACWESGYRLGIADVASLARERLGLSEERYEELRGEDNPTLALITLVREELAALKTKLAEANKGGDNAWVNGYHCGKQDVANLLQNELNLPGERFAALCQSMSRELAVCELIRERVTYFSESSHQGMVECEALKQQLADSQKELSGWVQGQYDLACYLAMNFNLDAKEVHKAKKDGIGQGNVLLMLLRKKHDLLAREIAAWRDKHQAVSDQKELQKALQEKLAEVAKERDELTSVLAEEKMLAQEEVGRLTDACTTAYERGKSSAERQDLLAISQPAAISYERGLADGRSQLANMLRNVMTPEALAVLQAATFPSPAYDIYCALKGAAVYERQYVPERLTVKCGNVEITAFPPENVEKGNFLIFADTLFTVDGVHKSVFGFTLHGEVGKPLELTVRTTVDKP